MSGFIFALIAGSFMAIQGVFNTRLTESSSMWVANTVVHSTGLVVCLLLWFFSGRASFAPLLQVPNKWYFIGGILGAVIVYAVIKTIASLGPTVGVMTFLSTQLLTAYIIELFGLFGTEVVPFDFKKVIGLALVVGGIVVFKI
ncbi:MAG: DMT family transporter [Vallitaleaceae bacterium]|nr:DMT family transporter [Vallitaleaceae bacterium]